MCLVMNVVSFWKPSKLTGYKELVGIDLSFVQDNLSRSSKGVLHFQKTKPQGKLIRVVKGKVFDVAIDVRKDSATSDVIVSNRMADELADVAEKVYTRDLFGSD